MRILQVGINREAVAHCTMTHALVDTTEAEHWELLVVVVRLDNGANGSNRIHVLVFWTDCVQIHLMI